MALAVLELSGLTQTHGRTRTLHGLTLPIEPGRITVVLGGAGSGKSTLLRILAGFESPRAGVVELDGRSILRLPAHRRRFGVVQQPDLLFPHMTVARNVEFPLRMRRTSPANRGRLVAATLEQLQLAHVAACLPAALTPAERQRAVLARATVFAPRVLLLDEPLSDQDPPAKALAVASLRRIHDMLGATTLIATRHGTDAMMLADRLAVMSGGVLEQYGTPEEIFDRPRNASVASLLGETNLLPGLVDKVDDDIAIVRLDCGPVVQALRGRTLLPGDACVVGLRPDRIAVAATEAAGMGDGAIDGTILDIQFLGHTYRLRLLIGSGVELILHRAAAAGLRGLTPGSPVAIAWQPHHAQAFAPEAR
jgi:putative spermidine/putrescine transport system ATP-binding protein